MGNFLAMAAAQAGAGLIQAISSGYMAMQQKEMAERYEQEIADLEANRQAIPDLSEFIQDRSSQIQNTMANLQVSTEATRLQAEQTDQALENQRQLVLRGGFGSGGATELARQALQSKLNISAQLEQQEVRNIMLRAQGEEARQRRILQEGRRVDAARAGAAQFGFAAQESRDIAKLNRASALMGQADFAKMQYTQAALGGAGSALGAGLGAGFGGQAGSMDYTGDLNRLGFTG